MRRRDFIGAAGLVGAVMIASVDVVLGPEPQPGVQLPDRKPNIVFILADDLGIGTESSYGADHFKTPNIDDLARGGIRYTNTYTVPLCGPSRGARSTP